MQSPAQRSRCSGGILVVATVALLMAALVTEGATAAFGSPGRSDAQLAAQAAHLEAEGERIGAQLLAEDDQRNEIVLERDVARTQLARWLAQAYMRESSGGDVVTQVLVSGSLVEAADRMRVAAIVAEHHSRLERTLGDAEAQLDLGQLEHARQVTRLSATQVQLVRTHAEQDRRAFARVQAEREHAIKQQAVDARRRDVAAAALAKSSRAVQVPGTLVGLTGASLGPVMPLVSGPPSPQLIDAYLAAKGSPMAGQGAAFLTSAQRWQVDPRLLVAIAGAESNFGQSLCGPYNAWGWSCPNDPADFGTWADGIDTVMRGLRSGYLNEGRTSVALIQQKYCPVGAANDPTGLNSHWATNVTRFLLEQGGDPSSVGPGPVAGLVMPDLGGLGLGSGSAAAEQ